MANDAVRIVPQLFCSVAEADYTAVQNLAAVELQLMAARANRSAGTVLVARGNTSCPWPPIGPADLQGQRTALVVLKEMKTDPQVAMAIAAQDCRHISIGMLCTRPGAP
jgi:hypothetical protein